MSYGDLQVHQSERAIQEDHVAPALHFFRRRYKLDHIFSDDVFTSNNTNPDEQLYATRIIAAFNIIFIDVYLLTVIVVKTVVGIIKYFYY